MEFALLIIFVAAYTAIAFEHPLHINKSASALVGAGLLWTIYALFSNSANLHSELAHTIEEIAQITFFLMGAMTIVELIDSHSGFDIITKKINTTKLSSLLMVVMILTFFLSAVLDNLTTTIVMVSLMKKILGRKEDRLVFAGLIVISSNAGGAWSPIGDVTTTMLWVGGQITSAAVIKGVLIPSIVAALVPLTIYYVIMRGKPVQGPTNTVSVNLNPPISNGERNFIFFLGIGCLIFVPIFKIVTHLPPFLGVLFGVGILWLATDIIHRKKDFDTQKHLTLAYSLSKIDLSSIVFFIGILLAVATLQHAQILADLAHWLDNSIGNLAIIVMLIGAFSSIVDNVPMVAGTMSMYNSKSFFIKKFI